MNHDAWSRYRNAAGEEFLLALPKSPRKRAYWLKRTNGRLEYRCPRCGRIEPENHPCPVGQQHLRSASA